MKLTTQRVVAWVALAVIGVVVASATAQPVDRISHPMVAAPHDVVNETAICLDQPECQEIQMLSGQVKVLKTRVDQLTSQMQPILRRASVFCQSSHVSANGAGDTRDCGAYLCDPVVGTCLQRCSSVNDCTPPYVCNEANQCEWPH
jgi:hypothetical protein